MPRVAKSLCFVLLLLWTIRGKGGGKPSSRELRGKNNKSDEYPQAHVNPGEGALSAHDRLQPQSLRSQSMGYTSYSCTGTHEWVMGETD